MKNINLAHLKVAILATDGFEQAELSAPKEFLESGGAKVEIVSLESGKIKGWNKKKWGKSIKVDAPLKKANVKDYQALVLPGGQMNPDNLRANKAAIKFIKDFAKAGKVIAAICHAPWLLIEAGLAKGKKMTCYPSIRTDLKNAGAKVQDKPVVVDGQFITSRNPDDLKDFNQAIASALLKVKQPDKKAKKSKAKKVAKSVVESAVKANERLTAQKGKSKAKSATKKASKSVSKTKLKPLKIKAVSVVDPIVASLSKDGTLASTSASTKPATKRASTAKKAPAKAVTPATPAPATKPATKRASTAKKAPAKEATPATPAPATKPATKRASTAKKAPAKEARPTSKD